MENKQVMQSSGAQCHFGKCDVDTFWDFFGILYLKVCDFAENSINNYDFEKYKNQKCKWCSKFAIAQGMNHGEKDVVDRLMLTQTRIFEMEE